MVRTAICFMWPRQRARDARTGQAPGFGLLLHRLGLRLLLRAIGSQRFQVDPLRVDGVECLAQESGELVQAQALERVSPAVVDFDVELDVSDRASELSYGVPT